MDSILNWYREEGIIFKGGSGAGRQPVAHPLQPRAAGRRRHRLGPGVSFMRGADASAGTIKSGGKTRRAAKMVILDADHPDVEEFIWCKAKEERKARVLRDAGFDMDLDGADSFSIQYQNANNSVRVTDEFMQAVERRRRLGPRRRHQRRGHPHGQGPRPVPRDRRGGVGVRRPRPAVRHHDQPLAHRRQHRVGSTARNPCSEYVHLDNSACNLASINLLKFLRDDDTLRRRGASSHAVEVIFTAQEILVGNADYPTEKIAETTRAFRQLGLGYANLGALLMALGLPYDSDEGRALGGRHHVAHDRSRLRHVGSHRQPHGPVRRLRRQRGAHAAGAAHAPRRRRPASTRSSCRRRCSTPPARHGTTPSPAARSSACATARPRCWRPPARSG